MTKSTATSNNQVNKMKPAVVIFSSSELVPVAEAVQANLETHFEVTVWTQGFFQSNEIILNSFLKQLLRFDGAVLLLGADDLRVSSNESGEPVAVPSDNVVFELGACMARFGTQKTFFICPSAPSVQLPSYFKAYYPLTYEDRSDGNLQAATSTACRSIVLQFENMERDAFASDLPSQGLAIGYFNNFVNPTYERFSSIDRKLSAEIEWLPGTPWEFNLVMPETDFMDRKTVESYFMSLMLDRCNLDLKDGRNINVYVRRRTDSTQPLRIYDIPTTLLTSESVIEKIDDFWGGGGDKKFRNSLKVREIASFQRAIEELLKPINLVSTLNPNSSKKVRVLKLSELSKDLARPL